MSNAIHTLGFVVATVSETTGLTSDFEEIEAVHISKGNQLMLSLNVILRIDIFCDAIVVV